MIPKKVSDVLFPNELYFTNLNPLHEEGQKGQIRVFHRDTDQARETSPTGVERDPRAIYGTTLWHRQEVKGWGCGWG